MPPPPPPRHRTSAHAAHTQLSVATSCAHKPHAPAGRTPRAAHPRPCTLCARPAHLPPPPLRAPGFPNPHQLQDNYGGSFPFPVTSQELVRDSGLNLRSLQSQRCFAVCRSGNMVKPLSSAVRASCCQPALGLPLPALACVCGPVSQRWPRPRFECRGEAVVCLGRRGSGRATSPGARAAACLHVCECVCVCLHCVALGRTGGG